ncbi:MAG: hypothetical protein ACK5JU_10655, partial [Bacteroidales bacterium]
EPVQRVRRQFPDVGRPRHCRTRLHPGGAEVPEARPARTGQRSDVVQRGPVRRGLLRLGRHAEGAQRSRTAHRLLHRFEDAEG